MPWRLVGCTCPAKQREVTAGPSEHRQRQLRIKAPPLYLHPCVSSTAHLQLHRDCCSTHSENSDLPCLVRGIQEDKCGQTPLSRIRRRGVHNCPYSKHSSYRKIAPWRLFEVLSGSPRRRSRYEQYCMGSQYAV